METEGDNYSIYEMKHHKPLKFKFPSCLRAFSAFLPLYAIALSAIPSAHGEVILQDSYAADAAGGAPTQLDDGLGPWGYEIDVTESFSAAGHDKLILVYSARDSAGIEDTAIISVTNVTYDGQALTQAVFANCNGTLVTAGIFYLDNVATDGILRIELSAGDQANFGFGLYAVDGLKAGVQDTGSGRDPLSAATVTMTTSSGFFVQEATRNNQALAGDPEDDYQTLYNYSVNEYRGLSQYQLTTAPGDFLAPIGNTGVNFRIVVTAAFEAISDPEPAADPKITSFTSVGVNLWELTLTGEADTGYEFYSSTTLDFNPGTLLENLTQGDPADAGDISGTNDSLLTTDSAGHGKVRVTLTGNPADFVRAQSVP